ncbi:MAG: sigma-70 family RNA polymerase sigma factor [Myxococcales bacterium]|nr:sigma-70 family RNA polymerase sigma factor [Myxococcales bacterium]MCB9718538.1 sigma-70 family RNA polymerase sigma factor [Myxococcales bacterium]
MPDPRRGGSSPSTSSPDPWRRELAEVYRAHAGFVLRGARHLGVPEAHLDDVVHEVFIIAHRRLPDFDEARGGLKSWLFGITRRVVLHHRRAAARHQRRLRVVPTPPSQPRPDEVVARQQAADHVQRFLDGLPPRQRLVFALADVEGMPAVEVARALEINVNTIYARLRAARIAFARYLDALDGEEGKA